MGLLDDVGPELLAEQQRAAGVANSTGFGADDRFWRSLAYSFRLVEDIGPLQEIQSFPLVINPERYEKTHPFAIDVTPTQEGGIFVERQGVVISTITLEGTTGFKPRFNPDETGPNGTALPLSGHAHFKRLQDLCFKEHSKRVKDPERAAHVVMTFHAFKDDEHYIVEPEEFSLSREKGERVLYRYRIRLKVLGEVKDVSRPISEDQPVIDSIAQPTKQLSVAIAQALASLDDTFGITSKINATVSAVTGGYATALDVGSQVNTEVTQIMGAASEYARATKRTIAIPFAAIATARNRIDQLTTILRQSASIPLDVIQLYQNIEDSLDVIATYPELFVESFDDAAEELLRLSQGPALSSTSDLEAAQGSEITQTEQLRSSALRPGDLRRVQSGIFQRRRTFPRYEGFREVIIYVHDTLETIAARELNNARRWIDLALANELTAPYISDEGLPGTKRPGDTILIPTEKRGGDPEQIRSKGDGELRASQLEVILGRDLQLEFGADGKADLVVDTTLGSEDFKTVAAVDNLSQAMVFILSIERGTDVLYQQIGYERIIGRRGTYERLINAQLSVLEAVQQDPRIVSTSGVKFNQNATGDALEIELNANITRETQIRVRGVLLS